MRNDNFIRVINFISAFLLFFAVSVYDPCAYAKTQTLEDDALAQIDGEAGINLNLNVSVHSSATSFALGNGSDQSINFGSLEIANGTPGGSFVINSDVVMDVFTEPSGTWLYFDPFLTAQGVSITGNDLRIKTSTLDQIIGNVAISGVYFGTNVSTAIATPALSVPYAPWILMGAGANGGTQSGIQLWAEASAYVNSLKYTWNTSGKSLTVSGIYVYGPYNAGNYPNITGQLWPTLNGNAYIGGTFTNYNTSGANVGTIDAGPATINVGTTGGNTSLRISMPAAMSIRIRDFAFSDITSFGPIAVDNAIFYRNIVTIRNL